MLSYVFKDPCEEHDDRVTDTEIDTSSLQSKVNIHEFGALKQVIQRGH